MGDRAPFYLLRSCTEKRGFLTRFGAQRVASRVTRLDDDPKPVRVYKCVFCGLKHWGHCRRKPAQERLTPEEIRRYRPEIRAKRKLTKPIRKQRTKQRIEQAKKHKKGTT